MNITTRNDKFSTLIVKVDCSNSTAVSEVYIRLHLDKTSFVTVKYRSGDEWDYFVPTPALVAGLGEKSVGRFVATVIKPNATYSNCVVRREAVGV